MKKKVLLFAGAIIAAHLCFAASNFSGDITVDGVTKHLEFNTITDLSNAFTNEQLKDYFPNYTDTSNVTASNVNIRGVEADFTYVGNTLTLTVPSAGIDVSFTGTTRDDAQDQFSDWFKKSGSEQVTNLFHAFVSQTATDPVAGNPTSMLANMGSDAFSMGNDVWTDDSIEKSEGFFTLTPSYSTYTENGATVKNLWLPIGYARYFNKGKDAFYANLPISLTQTDKNNSYSAGLSMGLKHSITKNWSLTPSITASGLASQDLGAAAAAYGGFVTSDISIGTGIIYGMKNSIGYVKTQKINANGYSIDYNLSNTMVQNGVYMTYIPKFSTMGYGLNYSRTDVLGTAWYVNNYNSIGANVSLMGNDEGYRYSRLSLGANYLFGANNFKGININLKWTI